MPFFVNDTRHWRERAEQLRAVAGTVTDPVARGHLDQLVLAYERMAERAEERELRRENNQDSN